MRTVITGGGTGGHIFPALEIAKEFIEQDARTQIIFVGNTGGLEERLAQNAGFQFFGLRTLKLVGQGPWRKFLALIYFGGALLKSMWFLLRNRPRVVIGVGGYVSAPMIVAGFFLGIRRYICEQNVVPGLANKVLAKIAHKVFISFPDSAKYFPGCALVHTGNPIRKQFFALEPKAKRGNSLNILVTGGSMGAAFLNDEVPRALALLKQDCPALKVIHQTGPDKLASVEKAYHDARLMAKVVQFIDNMPEIFRTHDLLISRAGATVAAEIMAAGMPAILVPYRFAHGHQRENALFLADKKASVMLEEGENFPYELAQIIRKFYENPTDLITMGQRAKAMGTPKAAAHIVKTVLKEC